MKLVLLVWGGLFIATFSYGQKLEYNCKSNENLSVSVNVTPALQPLDYQKKKIYIVKYEISAGSQRAASFFIYKYESKLYVLDGSSFKLNPSIDPVLFSYPHQNSYELSLSGIFENTASTLLNYTTINGVSFYKYNIMSPKKSLNITELIFDKNMDINEMKIASGNATCSCTKSNVIIKLRQR